MPRPPEDREGPGGKSRIVSSVLRAAFGTVRAEVPEGLFAVDNIASVDIVEPFDNQTLDLTRAVFFAKISRYDVMVNSFFEKLAGVCRSARLHFLLNELLQFRR
jgi:hypothetical protein